MNCNTYLNRIKRGIFSSTYIYICEHIIFLLCYFLSNSKYIIDMLHYKFFDVRSLM
jgi:hypothetical protein